MAGKKKETAEATETKETKAAKPKAPKTKSAGASKKIAGPAISLTSAIRRNGVRPVISSAASFR